MPAVTRSNRRRPCASPRSAFSSSALCQPPHATAARQRSRTGRHRRLHVECTGRRAAHRVRPQHQSARSRSSRRPTAMFASQPRSTGRAAIRSRTSSSRRRVGGQRHHLRALVQRHVRRGGLRVKGKGLSDKIRGRGTDATVLFTVYVPTGVKVGRVHRQWLDRRGRDGAGEGCARSTARLKVATSVGPWTPRR